MAASVTSPAKRRKRPRRRAAPQSPPAASARARLPRGLYRYIWLVSGRAQIVLAALAVAVFLLDLAPLELQRRIVNEAIKKNAFSSLIWLCGAYAAVAVLLGGTKLALNIYRSSVGEAANQRLRIDTYGAALHHSVDNTTGKEGIGVSIILSEVEPLGGFVGTSISDPVLHGGILVSTFAYLTYLQPWMALVAAGLFAPQFFFVPMMQNAINARTKSRIQVMRNLSTDIVSDTTEDELEREAGTFRRRAANVYRLNMEIFRRKFSMNFLMNFLNHMGIVGILFVGGWQVLQGHTEVGTVVAFISGLNQINDPWGDLVNFFRDVTNARVKYDLIAGVLNKGDAAEAVEHASGR